VHTVELREEYVQRVLKNLRRTGLDVFWSSQTGDAGNVGVEFTADVMIMDVPDPRSALGNLSRNLRPGGRVCAYVPNMNQAASAAEALREMNYFDVRAAELLEREIEVHPGGVRPSFQMLGHTGYLIFGRKRA
jgi:tRNA (adenine57-N1/adenine58-N1)-methyltransferase